MDAAEVFLKKIRFSKNFFEKTVTLCPKKVSYILEGGSMFFSGYSFLLRSGGV